MVCQMDGNTATLSMAKFCPSIRSGGLLNPVNPLDINYDPDADGWLDRDVLDTPATQGKWDSRIFTSYPENQQINNGASSLCSLNIMEFENSTTARIGFRLGLNRNDSCFPSWSNCGIPSRYEPYRRERTLQIWNKPIG